MSKSLLRLPAALLAVAIMLVSCLSWMADANAAEAAPKIARPGLKWFNVEAPIPIASLHGRIVILDFWTEGCINCIHIIPILRAIEQKYPEQVVVIGVHSPKFAEEKSAASVQDAIQRYEIRHPIVHDPEMSIWRDYDVQAWPTLVIVGPDGNVLIRLPGEPNPERFGKAIGELVASAGQSGELKPAKLALTPVVEPKGRFLFPGKLKPAPGGDKRRWVLADAGHNQIVLLDDDGNDVKRYGNGAAGFKDGDATQASFDHPQGLIATEDAIFVADTGNHAIRRIDRKSGLVTTLAGDGKRGTTLQDAAQPARGASLASPWDLEKKGRQLFIANAGTHQIGVIDLDAGTVARLAGSGNEDLVAGAAANAAFAQPSGLALSGDGKSLYVADSESSAVRVVNLDERSTKTLVGAGLFDFGKTNGTFDVARLQHPLGVAVYGDNLLVADTYNSRVRTLDLAQRKVSEFDGGRFTCTDPICYPLREPAGIAVATPDRILLVDTGNQRIEEFRPSLKTSRTWAR